MKPIKLTMQAFGPFAGKEVIDFSRLGRNPLFLINGPTGAGKSSILDAICFALYGQTAGAERDGSQMRCDHSDMTVLTEITLEFELGEKRYLIRRIPKQEKAKSRGEGTTTQQPEAVMKELDGSGEGRLIVSKSVTDATKEIQRLIGLGVEQFRQVMILPQGKFRELLMADSKEREAIFSQLFETHIYKRIENRLKEKAGGITREVAEHESQVKGILQAADLSAETELDEELADLGQSVAVAKTDKDRAEHSLKNAQKEKDEADALIKRFETLALRQKERGEKLQQVDVINDQKSQLQRSEKAQAIYHIYSSQRSEGEKLIALNNEWQQANDLLDMAKADHQMALEEKNNATEAASALDGLKQEKVELDRLELVNTELLNAKSGVADAQVTYKKSKAALEEKNAVLERLDEELKTKTELFDRLNKKLEHYADVKLQHQTLQNKVQECEKRDQLNQRILNGKAEVEKADKDRRISESDWQNAKKHTLKIELRWHSGQANLLAQQLEEGEPCLVCGSVEHPNPAQGSGDSLVSKSEVDEARADEAQLLNVFEAKKDKLAKYTGHLEVLKSQLADTENNLGDDASSTLEQISNSHEQASKDITELESSRAQLGEITIRLQGIRTEQSESKSEMTHLETSANNSKQAAAIAESRWAALQDQIPEKYRASGVFQSEISKVSQQIDSIANRFNKAEKGFKVSQSALDVASAKENTLSDQLKVQKTKAQELRSNWMNSLSESEFADEPSFLVAILDDEQKQGFRASIDEYRSAMDSLNAVIKELEMELTDKAKPDLTELENALIETIKVFQEIEEKWRVLEARSKQLSSLKEKLVEARKKSDSLAKQYAVLGTLSKVAGGGTDQKVSLQRFVLSVLLDDVLIQASQRLKLMSKGRYQLVRKEDKAKGNKASGLELEVEDGNTGKSRSVATLSGGESFIAALSLALGLSDVVQSYAGGIKLDMLFIDEGFGSLDVDSLDAAIQVLIDLQSSGRTIGIISHVTELKEQMALRIDVQSGSSGSHISSVAA